MIDIIPYWCYPYVIPTFHVVIIHRLFFLVLASLVVGYVFVLWVFQLFFLSYRGEERRMYVRNKKWNTLKTH